MEKKEEKKNKEKGNVGSMDLNFRKISILNKNGGKYREEIQYGKNAENLWTKL